ncbi:hypothetical protein GCM10009765_49920 [Fodinicola feengrottensis]|uniref:Uncharacterized protein n=1 Tax=Fodinicola feengrottensis TaxID=435914 RepID=A0ABP4TXM9_9ACTN
MQGSARQWRFAVAILVGALTAALVMPADRVDGATVPSQDAPRPATGTGNGW